MTSQAVALTDVRVEYPTPTGVVSALGGVTLEFAPGTSTAVIGRSGCGKSTLISVISLLRSPTAGRVQIAGVDTGAIGPRATAKLRADRIGVVFQAFHLEPSLTALQNVMLPWFVGGSAGSKRHTTARAIDIMEGLGIGDLARRRPHGMSGGQRQRVAIARALLTNPAVFVADEPTGNLDEETANEVAQQILALPRTFGAAVILVTHDHAVAKGADRIIELAHGDVVGDSQCA